MTMIASNATAKAQPSAPNPIIQPIIEFIIAPIAPSIMTTLSVHGSGGSLRRARHRLGGRHATAFLRATSARLGALLAMAHRVSRALLVADIANGSGQPAELGSQLAASRHVAGCQPAYVRAIHIELDTSDHLCRVLLFQAGDRAAVARDCTVIAGVNARIEMILIHIRLLLVLRHG